MYSTPYGTGSGANGGIARGLSCACVPLPERKVGILDLAVHYPRTLD